jgi:colanic acid/amylovoran biosynthesis protein
MEFGNIGNYYIIEPFVRELHNNFPGANIKTTLQMSERFCEDEKVEVVPMELYYDLANDTNLDLAKKEIRLVEEFLENGEFTETTPYIDEVLNADIVIDFSGDIWGDNANFLGKDRFEVGLYKDLVAQRLGKPTFMLAGSPGPFNDERTKELAKNVFKGFTAVTNREPISSKVLKEEGFDISNVRDLACPAFLFEPANAENIDELIKKEDVISEDKPTVGFIVCGWNFLEGPFDKWPRDDSDYEVFAKAVEFITNSLGARVCLMSHSNGFPIPPAEFKLTHGRDYPIIKQLQEVLNDRGIAKDVFALDGVYDTWTTKAIISNFDMLVSGRVHAAVAGFSQCVPTVVIDYGHEPKAHKLLGFATVAGQEKYVSDPAKESDLINKIKDCWENRELVKKDLEEKVPVVKEQARENFRLIKKLVSKEMEEV